MTILSREFLDCGNCYICFADLPEEIDLVIFSGFEESHGGEVFFEFCEYLLEVYCDITRSYSMFDPHLPTQFSKPDDVREIADSMLAWARIILTCPANVFHEWLNLYDGTEKSATITVEEMRKDLLDTLLFLVERISLIALSDRVLAFDGV